MGDILAKAWHTQGETLSGTSRATEMSSAARDFRLGGFQVVAGEISISRLSMSLEIAYRYSSWYGQLQFVVYAFFALFEELFRGSPSAWGRTQVVSQG